MTAGYWGVRFRSLDKRGAKRFVALGAKLGFEGYITDPRTAFQAMFDREDVALLAGLLHAGLESGRGLLSDRYRWGGESLAYDMNEWLELVGVPKESPLDQHESERVEPYGWGIEFTGLTRNGAMQLSGMASDLGARACLLTVGEVVCHVGVRVAFSGVVGFSVGADRVVDAGRVAEGWSSFR